MLSSCLFVIVGLAILVYGADLFVAGAAGLARQLGMPPLIIGLTIVGFATSAPEIMAGSVSAWQGRTAIAIGNALGSNITNIGLVLGISALLLPITVASGTLKRAYGLMLLSVLLAFLLMLDGHLSRVDAALLLGLLLLFIGAIVWIARHSRQDDPLEAEFSQAVAGAAAPAAASLKLLAGLILLLAGAELLIRGAVYIAGALGVSELVIGLTIVAIGTSLPELAASIVSIIRKEADIAIGNIIGSNMFNMLAVLGIPGLIQPAYFERAVLLRDFPAMIGLCLLLGILVFITGRGRLRRTEGALLFLCFAAYQCILFWQVAG